MGLPTGSTLPPSFNALPGQTSSGVLQTAPSSSSIILTTGWADASASGSKNPQQVTGCTVSSSGFSNQGVQPLPAGSSGLLPLGTIIMPANDRLPPGSLILPQGSLPGGQLRLALPSQLPVLHPQLPLSQPPTHLHTSASGAAVASVKGASEALTTKAAPSGQKVALMHVRGQQEDQQGSACGPAGVNRRIQQGVSTAAEPQSTAGADMETDAVSVTVSEGTSVLGKLL